MSKAIEYVRSQHPVNVWDFILKFIATKEGHKILIGIFVLCTIVLIWNPELALKIKIALFNFILKRLG